MLHLCSLGIQLAYYIRNLNNKMVECLLSVAQTFILIFTLVCYSNICNRLSETNAPEHRVQTSLKRCGLKFFQDSICLQNSLGGGGAGPFFSSKSKGCVIAESVAPAQTMR